jgi:hypothetical protein
MCLLKWASLPVEVTSFACATAKLGPGRPIQPGDRPHPVRLLGDRVSRASWCPFRSAVERGYPRAKRTSSA